MLFLNVHHMSNAYETIYLSVCLSASLNVLYVMESIIKYKTEDNLLCTNNFPVHIIYQGLQHRQADAKTYHS